MISISSLQYLAARLAQIDCVEIAAAAELVRKAQASVATFERSLLAEHALFHTVWNHLTRSLDHSDFSPVHYDAVEALEAEMAGRALTIRQSLGWITRSVTGPTEFPSINEFMN